MPASIIVARTFAFQEVCAFDKRNAMVVLERIHKTGHPIRDTKNVDKIGDHRDNIEVFKPEFHCSIERKKRHNIGKKVIYMRFGRG